MHPRSVGCSTMLNHQPTDLGDVSRSSDRPLSTLMRYEALKRSRDLPRPAAPQESKHPSRSLMCTITLIWHYLRSATAAFCLVACVGLLASWILTYHAKFELFNNVAKFELYCVECWKGKLQLSHNYNMGKTSRIGEWVCWTIPDDRLYSDYAQHAQEWEATVFGISWTKDNKSVAMPYWVLVAFAGLISMILKPKPRLQYSFPDLLLLTTVAAVFLACIALVAKNLG